MPSAKEQRNKKIKKRNILQNRRFALLGKKVKNNVGAMYIVLVQLFFLLSTTFSQSEKAVALYWKSQKKKLNVFFESILI